MTEARGKKEKVCVSPGLLMFEFPELCRCQEDAVMFFPDLFWPFSHVVLMAKYFLFSRFLKPRGKCSVNYTY